MIEEEKENFDVDWLNERYPFDVEARDKALETKMLALLADKPIVTLVDVGAGTGSNCLYFISKLSQHQKWFLIEQNTDLKKATIRRLKDYASYHKYSFDQQQDHIKIKAPKKNIEVTIINDSLLNMETCVDVSKVDIVTANAVFDLFSEAQLIQLVNIISKHQLTFYHTLSYQGMFFEPDDPFDKIFIDTYNEHMERPQAFGKALGTKANACLLTLFEAQPCTITTATSTWQIEPNDLKMHYYLLNFMENALGEMNLPPAKQQNFEKWVQRKKELIITAQQRLKVEHLDVLVINH